MRATDVILILALAFAGGALAQVRVRTETIRPPLPPATADQLISPARDGAAGEARGGMIADPSRLPPAVAAMRERILAAARSGDPQKLVALMQASAIMPVFTRTQRQDPGAIWKESFPDSAGVEALSILVSILEVGAARLDADTPQEIYLWPYFAQLPLNALSQAQKVDLFRIITGSDYKEMLELNRYSFYRLGIAPDGAWRYFVPGQ
jgi:hypothetical protein